MSKKIQAGLLAVVLVAAFTVGFALPAQSQATAWTTPSVKCITTCCDTNPFLCVTCCEGQPCPDLMCP